VPGVDAAFVIHASVRLVDPHPLPRYDLPFTAVMLIGIDPKKDVDPDVDAVYDVPVATPELIHVLSDVEYLRTDCVNVSDTLYTAVMFLNALTFTPSYVTDLVIE
jgi:hypothetical protein